MSSERFHGSGDDALIGSQQIVGVNLRRAIDGDMTEYG
jgi:hypothetical protein